MRAHCTVARLHPQESIAKGNASYSSLGSLTWKMLSLVASILANHYLLNSLRIVSCLELSCLGERLRVGMKMLNVWQNAKKIPRPLATWFEVKLSQCFLMWYSGSLSRENLGFPSPLPAARIQYAIYCARRAPRIQAISHEHQSVYKMQVRMAPWINRRKTESDSHTWHILQFRCTTTALLPLIIFHLLWQRLLPHVTRFRHSGSHTNSISVVAIMTDTESHYLTVQLVKVLHRWASALRFLLICFLRRLWGGRSIKDNGVCFVVVIYDLSVSRENDYLV